ncbi:MAG: hypothetical protein OXB89_09915 [Anaerolineaceae bacterium]|nr:hypothetical protein [Anaerolineaceae bacterium]
MNKALVIDTDITGSASMSKEKTPTNCRVFLEAVREFGHQFVFSPEMKNEWEFHRSGWSQTWLRTMQVRRQVKYTDDFPNENLRRRISRLSKDVDSREAMLKDIHLLELALVTDRTITSRNNSERKLFADASQRIRMIRDIMWVNPDTESEFCLDWLRRGAPLKRKRQLGYQHRER